MQVKDIMTKKVVSVGPDESVMRVADIIFKNGFHGMPVMEKRKVIGIITEDDFFLKGYDDLYLPSYIQFLKSNKVIDGLPRNIKKKIEKLVEAKAKDLMTAPCITLTPATPVSKLMGLIKKTKFTTWPVTDKRNNLVGIVTLVDVLGAFKGGVGEMGTAYRKSAEKEREVDFLAKDIRSFWEKTYVFINKTHVRTWKGIFFIAFVSGAIAALFWTISVRIQNRSSAQVVNSEQILFDNR
jgi:acetoin utilization protein AcuB